MAFEVGNAPTRQKNRVRTAHFRRKAYHHARRGTRD